MSGTESSALFCFNTLFLSKSLPTVTDLTVGNFYCYPIGDIIGQKDTIALCPKWTLVDFYIDEGATAPNMENAPEWSRLLTDAMDGRVDLIITQKVSNVSKKMHEVTVCSRILAKQPHPIGIYFISEDIFTLASYYLNDNKDTFFLPYPGWELLPEGEEEIKGALHD